jgi:hypothetical protein
MCPSVRQMSTFQTNLPAIGHRNASRTGTNTASEGSRVSGTHFALGRIITYTFQTDSVRTKVRSRDLKCRATGQPAPAGSRGYNFTGLEVAHIFPLAEASVVCYVVSPSSIYF